MGSLMIWIARGLMVGGGALVGMLWEKISSAVSGILPASVNTNGKDGRPAWWYMTAIVTIAGAVIYFVAKSIAGKKKLFMLALAVLIVDYAFGGSVEGVIVASLIASFPAAAQNTRNITYLPEYIMYTIDVQATSFRIEITGDGVVFSLDDTGLNNLSGINLVGALPANTYIFHIADGYIRKNGSLTVTNASAGTALDVYGWSRSPGSTYVVHETAKAFANQFLDVPSPFLYAAFPSAGAADQFTLSFGRTSDTLYRNELEGYLAQFQDVTATRYNVNNYDLGITALRYLPSADQSVYLQRAQRAR